MKINWTSLRRTLVLHTIIELTLWTKKKFIITNRDDERIQIRSLKSQNVISNNRQIQVV